jgi:hypothetical protein
MRTHPTTAWIVSYRAADGTLRRHTYFTEYHAEQFARAMRHPSASVSSVRVDEINSFNPND